MKFRLVDRILEWEPWHRIRGVKVPSFEEYRLKDPFGDAPVLPESLILESLFELGNWLVMLSSDFSRMGVVIRVERATFERRVHPGERLVMDVALRSRREDGLLFDGEGLVGRHRVARGGGVLATPVPLGDFADPDDLRTLYSEIHRPERMEA